MFFENLPTQPRRFLVSEYQWSENDLCEVAPWIFKFGHESLIQSIASYLLSINYVVSHQGTLLSIMNWTTKQILGPILICTLVFTSGCASTFLRQVTKANGGRMDITYPSVRYAGDSLNPPDMLTPLILIDLHSQSRWTLWCCHLMPQMLSDRIKQNPKLIKIKDWL